MTVSLTHKFVSGKANGADNTLVQPSNWNDTHVLTCAANSVLGNNTGSSGNVVELAAGAAGLSVLAANLGSDLINALAALGISIPTTGDIKLTYKTTADTGWLMMNDQTIGNVSSGATYANANAQSLYTAIWNNISSPSGNFRCPVTGGLGASAAADWAAQKPLQLSQCNSRVIGIAGAGSGLSARVLGQAIGEETHVLSAGEMPQHNHSASDAGHGHTDGGHSHGVTVAGGTYFGSGNSGQYANSAPGSGQITGPTVTTGISINTGYANIQTGYASISIGNAGSGNAHNNMQPCAFWNAMIKL